MKISNTFKIELYRRLVKELGKDIHLDFEWRNKTEGKREEMLTIRNNSNYSTSFQLEPFYESYCKDPAVIHTIVLDIVLSFQRLKMIGDYHTLKDRIRIKLVNAERNQDKLADLPHIPYLDLAILFFIQFNSDGTNEGILINQNIMNLWKKNIMELYSDALLNMKMEAEPPEPIYKVLMDLSHENSADGEFDLAEYADPAQPIELYVLRNKNNYLGASRMLETETLKKLSCELGCSLYLLPASIHEILIMPVRNHIDLGEIETMVREINLSDVDIEFRLSNSIYMFDKETCSIRIVRNGIPL